MRLFCSLPLLTCVGITRDLSCICCVSPGLSFAEAWSFVAPRFANPGNVTNVVLVECGLLMVVALIGGPFPSGDCSDTL